MYWQSFFILWFILVILSPTPGLAIPIPAGPVNGVWTAADSPYEILGDISVATNDTLFIHHSVQIIFQGNFQLNVEGVLLASGEAENPIFFSGASWAGIRLENPNRTSQFCYCHILHANTGLNSVNAPMNVDYCQFFDQVKAINVFGVNNPNPATVTITNSIIDGCQQNGIFIVENSNTTVANCEITNCALDNSPRGAIQLSCQSVAGSNNPTIANNWIHDNTWQGLSAFDVTGIGNIFPTISDNVIEGNLSGIYLLYANGYFHNNTIQNNYVENNADSGAGVMVAGAASQPIFTDNVITGNYTGFYIIQGARPNLGDLVNDYPGDDGENDIYGNIDMNGNIWSVYLANGAVENIMAQNNLWGTTDIAEIEATIHDGRDDAGLGRVNYLPLYDNSIANEGDVWNSRRSLANYPNPFRHCTTIQFSLDVPQSVSLNIYDGAGRLITKLINSNLERGDHAYCWDGSNSRGDRISAGVYFYELQQCSGQKEVGRMILVK